MRPYVTYFSPYYRNNKFLIQTIADGFICILHLTPRARTFWIIQELAEAVAPQRRVQLPANTWILFSTNMGNLFRTCFFTYTSSRLIFSGQTEKWLWNMISLSSFNIYELCHTSHFYILLFLVDHLTTLSIYLSKRIFIYRIYHTAPNLTTVHCAHTV